MEGKKFVIRNWDEHFMRDAYHWAQKSKDPRTQMGAVFVYPQDRDAFAHAYNGLPRIVNDNALERFHKPNKEHYMEHAERNGIFHCARTGRATRGAVVYVQCLPCAPCARALINSGISEVVIHADYFNMESPPGNPLKPTFAAALEMFKEARVRIRYWHGVIGEAVLHNGELKTF